VLFATLPVAVASAERSFSKLKLINTYLRSFISQDRLDGVAPLASENECAKQLNIDDMIDTFVSKKVRTVKIDEEIFFKTSQTIIQAYRQCCFSIIIGGNLN